MGQLIYAGSHIGIEDAVLAYIEALTRHAFSEGKPFMLAIHGTTDDGDVVAQSLWLSPQTPIQFRYERYETVEFDRQLFSEACESLVSNGAYYVGDGPLAYKFTGGDADTNSQE